MREAVIVSTARTPIGRAYRGAFNMTHGATLGGHVVKHAVERAKVDPAEIEDVIMGCALPERATGQNIARQAAIRAGLPVTVSGMTVNRFCSLGPAGHRDGGAADHRRRSVGHRRGRARKHQPRAGRPLADRDRGLDHGAQARALHGHDRHGRHRGRALQGSARGAGRLFAGEPAAHGFGAAGPQVRRRDRAAADQEEEREQGHQGRNDRGGDAHQGRGQPARHHAGRPRRPQAGARGPFHHRRQCEPAFRRRLGLRRHGREARREAGLEAAWAPSAASPSPAASPTRWASARCSRCRSSCSAPG